MIIALEDHSSWGNHRDMEGKLCEMSAKLEAKARVNLLHKICGDISYASIACGACFICFILMSSVFMS